MNARRKQELLKLEAEHLENARFLNRADVVVMTESDEDERFWRAVFNHAVPNLKIMFNYAVQSSDKSAYGKTMCMKYVDCTTSHFVLAVDSDFDRFYKSSFPEKEYVFHTVTYSWENHYCWVPALDDWYNGLTDRMSFSFKIFLTSLSNTIHPYLVKLLAAKKNNIKGWTLDGMCSKILSIQPNRKEYLENDGERLIAEISKSLSIWESGLPGIDVVSQTILIQEAELLGMNYNNTYLYMQGHCIYDLTCRVGAALSGFTVDEFEQKVMQYNLSFERYSEISALTSSIRTLYT